jgi:hypothetical protein
LKQDSDQGFNKNVGRSAGNVSPAEGKTGRWRKGGIAASVENLYGKEAEGCLCHFYFSMLI